MMETSDSGDIKKHVTILPNIQPGIGIQIPDYIIHLFVGFLNNHKSLLISILGIKALTEPNLNLFASDNIFSRLRLAYHPILISVRVSPPCFHACVIEIIKGFSSGICFLAKSRSTPRTSAEIQDSPRFSAAQIFSDIYGKRATTWGWNISCHNF
jgi:hypothetical protein